MVFFIAIGLAGGTFAAGYHAIGSAPKGLAYIFTQTPRYEPKAWLEGRDRFPEGASLLLVQGDVVRLVAPGFHDSADATASYDGARVLFSGRLTGAAPWQVWEVALDGGMPRQITHCDADCIRPLYLPTGEVVYTKASSIEVAGKRITFAPGRYLTGAVLYDGRILFETERRPGFRELYTVYPDGTGVEALRCDHGPDRGDARQLVSGEYVFSSGRHLARITSASSEQIEIEEPDGNAIGPVAEIAPGEWLVSRRGKLGGFRLYRWSAENRLLSLLEVAGEASAVQPVVVAPRTPPREFPSALVPTRAAGNLLCLNARISRTPMDGTVVQEVRVYTQDVSGKPALLGRTPVESDGSFYVQVPADRPLQIELTDAAGKTVRREPGWFWMRPSEQRVCVGCHTGPERAPENKVPEILLKSIVPVKMTEVGR
ncbi:MAG TPA: hypothetical protein VGF16_11980 [Bryobacteraceae bacterium]